jgi:hypothetical protein
MPTALEIVQSERNCLMALADRIALIRKIEKMRASVVICYLTSLRPNVNARMAEDVVRVFIDHLPAMPATDKLAKIDLFLCSTGGDSMVPWRLVPLFRTFANSFDVLIPYCAYSAATLLALGADQIVMTPYAVLGPIDPTVGNDFNPTDKASGQKLGINVEDMQAYLHFVKETVGITQDEQVIKAVEWLAREVNPLAIGNVDRFLSQSRMIARKILNTHMKGTARDVDEIVENLTSKLYFHGHPINRVEAREELHLKVMKKPPAELEGAMWQLYKDYEQEFDNTNVYNPQGELASAHPLPLPGAPPAFPQREEDLLLTVVESAKLSSRQTVKRRNTLITAIGPGGIQRVTLTEDLSLTWAHTQAP